MAGVGEVVGDDKEFMRAPRLLANKFPEIEAMGLEDELEGTAILHIRPKVISVLDYTKGFGDTDLVRV